MVMFERLLDGLGMSNAKQSLYTSGRGSEVSWRLGLPDFQRSAVEVAEVSLTHRPHFHPQIFIAVRG
jgi:hypothetical protein